MTVDEALAGFEAGWVDAQPITPQTAYRRTLRLLRLYLQDHPPALDADAARLDAESLRGFVVWHRAHALADTAEGSRKVAVHVARLAEHLGVDVGRDELRALVPDAAEAGG